MSLAALFPTMYPFRLMNPRRLSPPHLSFPKKTSSVQPLPKKRQQEYSKGRRTGRAKWSSRPLRSHSRPRWMGAALLGKNAPVPMCWRRILSGSSSRSRASRKYHLLMVMATHFFSPWFTTSRHLRRASWTRIFIPNEKVREQVCRTWYSRTRTWLLRLFSFSGRLAVAAEEVLWALKKMSDVYFLPLKKTMHMTGKTKPMSLSMRQRQLLGWC
mmetsp:Transcript_31906/g.67982  ORF Transcript_31906/g.67982 Transcript_31906/m.67982 type:complete len:214 (+) Transcript_31906:636-1277(+)